MVIFIFVAAIFGGGAVVVVILRSFIRGTRIPYFHTIFCLTFLYDIHPHPTWWYLTFIIYLFDVCPVRPFYSCFTFMFSVIRFFFSSSTFHLFFTSIFTSSRNLKHLSRFFCCFCTNEAVLCSCCVTQCHAMLHCVFDFFPCCHCCSFYHHTRLQHIISSSFSNSTSTLILSLSLTNTHQMVFHPLSLSFPLKKKRVEHFAGHF